MIKKVYKLILFWVFSQVIQGEGEWQNWWQYTTGACTRTCNRGVLDVRDCIGNGDSCYGTNARVYFVKCTGDKCVGKNVDSFPLVLILACVFCVLLTVGMARLFFRYREKERQRKFEAARRRFSYENPAFWKY